MKSELQRGDIFSYRRNEVTYFWIYLSEERLGRMYLVMNRRGQVSWIDSKALKDNKFI